MCIYIYYTYIIYRNYTYIYNQNVHPISSCPKFVKPTNSPQIHDKDFT